MTYLIEPFFNYNPHNGFYPDVAEENPLERHAVERMDYVASGGKRLSYLIGSRNFRDVTFRWQDSTKKALWETFWNEVKDGSVFTYYNDDSIPIAGSGTLAGSGTVAGQTTAGDAVVGTDMVMEMTELIFEEEEVYGYWSVSVQMREAV